MVYTSSNNFNANLDPNLLKWVGAASDAYTGPYKIQVFSGYRPGDPRQHGQGHAVDFRLIDPKTGMELPNYQSAKNYGDYQTVANLIRQKQMEMNPEYADRLRWGGYFGGGRGRYGALDLMHIDVGGGPTLGMEGGSWAGGATPEQQKVWGVSAGGGLGGAPTAGTPAAAAAPHQGPYSPQQYQSAILSAIRQMESGGKYDVSYGGKQFTDMSRHPDVHVNLPGGGYTSAAGAYQFIDPTWAKYQTQLGLKDFSPESQDKAAWANVLDTVGGQDKLNAMIAGGDPTAIARALSGQWASLLKDPNRFADLYKANLGQTQDPGQATAPGTTAQPTAPAAAAAAPPAKKSWQDLVAGMAKNFKGFGVGGEGGAGDATMPDRPVPATPVTESGMAPMLDANTIQAQRNQLAQALANLRPSTASVYGSQFSPGSIYG